MIPLIGETETSILTLFLMDRKNLKRKRECLRKNKNEHLNTFKNLTDIFPFIFQVKTKNKNMNRKR